MTILSIDSLQSIDASQLIADRPLQGQSPLIINGSFGYNDEKRGFSSTLSVNRVADRIFIAGTYNTASIYEKARTVVDFQLARSFSNKSIEVKFTIKDLLAKSIKYYFDFDRSGTFTAADKYFSNFNAPRIFSFYATFRF